MREAAEKKKELEKQHSDAVNELRTAQAQLGLLTNSKNAESERAQLSQNIESLQVSTGEEIRKTILPVTSRAFTHPRSLSLFAQSRIRELERKMELQNVRHDELLIELASLRRQQQHAGGSAQSLGAAFELDSRGSSPGNKSFALIQYAARPASCPARLVALLFA